MTFSVLTSASHMLKLEQYTEDQRGPCTKMTHKFVKCSIFIVKPINFFKALKNDLCGTPAIVFPLPTALVNTGRLIRAAENEAYAPSNQNGIVSWEPTAAR